MLEQIAKVTALPNEPMNTWLMSQGSEYQELRQYSKIYTNKYIKITIDLVCDFYYRLGLSI